MQNELFVKHRPLPLHEGAIIIDNSFLELLQTCPRLLEYDRVLRKRTASARPALNFGGAGHLVLEHRYKNYGADLNDPVEVLKCEQEQLDILTKHFNATPNPEDDWRNLNWAVEIFIKRYNSRYAVEPFNLLTGSDGKPLVEQSFAIPIAAYETKEAGGEGVIYPITSLDDIRREIDVPIIYAGKIDLPVSWDGSIFIGDHKTSSVLGDSVWDDLRVSPQQIGYSWAYWRSTGVMPIGFFVNAIRVRPMPDKPKGGHAAWWEENFQRLKEYISPDHLIEWEFNTLSLIEEFLWHHGRGYFPMKRKWCCGKYGRCAMYEVCYTPFKQREELLNTSLFVDNDWSPLKISDSATAASTEAKAGKSDAQEMGGPLNNAPTQVEPPANSSL
jgi:hypothetical protein